MSERSPLWRVALGLHLRVHVLRTLHPLFFVAVGAALAIRTWPALWQVVCLALGVLFGRGVLVAMNRVFEAPADIANPHADSGLEPMSIPRPVWIAFAVHAVLGLVVVAYILNALAGLLSFGLVVLLLVYSCTRKFTGLSHLLLGLGIGVAPLGAWVALRGQVGWDAVAAVLFGAGVVLWATGYDMVFSLLPELREPRGQAIFVRPMALAPPVVVRVSRLLQGAAVVAFFFTGVLAELGEAYYVGAFIVALCLLAAHSQVTPDRLERVRGPFSGLNLLVGPVLFAATAMSV